MDNTPAQPPATDPAQRRKRILVGFQRAFLGWLFIYMWSGRDSQGEGGFFGRTVDHIVDPWLQWSFLNIPLQFLLTLVVMFCAASDRPSAQRAGIWVGACTGVLIIGHIVLSVITA